MSPLPQCTALARISRGFIIVSSRWSEIHIQPLQEIPVWLPLLFLSHTSSCQGQFCDPGDCPGVPLRRPLWYLKCAVLEVWCRWICVHLQARVCSDCLMLQEKNNTFLIPRQVQDSSRVGTMDSSQEQPARCREFRINWRSSQPMEGSSMFTRGWQLSNVFSPSNLSTPKPNVQRIWVNSRKICAHFSNERVKGGTTERSCVSARANNKCPFLCPPPSTHCSGRLWASWQNLTQTIFSNWSACP